MAKLTLIEGDVFESVQDIPVNSIDCVVTSPPYWKRRTYNAAHGEREIGQEEKRGEYIDKIVALFREIRPTLVPTATCWLNLDDTRWPTNHLALVPERIAIRLQEEGWVIRSMIVWAKTNGLPEQQTARPRHSHERIIFFTPEESSHYNAAAVELPALEGTLRMRDSAQERLAAGEHREHDAERQKMYRKSLPDMERLRQSYDEAHATMKDTRRLRDAEVAPAEVMVSGIGTPSSEIMHPAIMPLAIAQRCIAGGCPIGGHVLDPFGGSGTTWWAARSLDRDATLIEIDPTYCADIRARQENIADLVDAMGAEE